MPPKTLRRGSSARRDKKTNDRQLKSLKAIKSGSTMEDNSIGSRALMSRADNQTGKDDERGVGAPHQKDNSTNSRILSSGQTDADRAVASEHQKDNSTNARVLASGGSDGDRAVTSEHQRDNSTNGRILSSHETPGGIDPEGQQYREGGGSTRAAGRYHIRPWAVRREHIQDGELPWAKMDGGVPAGKLPSGLAKFGDWKNGTLSSKKGGYFTVASPFFVAQFKDSTGKWVPFVGGANDMRLQMTSDTKVYVYNGSKNKRAVRIRAAFS